MEAMVKPFFNPRNDYFYNFHRIDVSTRLSFSIIALTLFHRFGQFFQVLISLVHTVIEFIVRETKLFGFLYNHGKYEGK